MRDWVGKGIPNPQQHKEYGITKKQRKEQGL
jgi:hypothetical protein